MSVAGDTLGGMSFDWSSVEVRDVAEMPRRGTAQPQIIEATCANCDTQYGLPRCRRSAFCTARCRDQAKYVRYARARRRQYADNPPLDIRHALWVKRIHALGAGYDDSARRISPSRRREVWERDSGLCAICGKPGDEVDHRDGPSDELTSLRLLCRPCHRRATAARVRPICSSVQFDAETLRSREEATVVLRVCDSADWETTWRQWHQAHVTRG